MTPTKARGSVSPYARRSSNIRVGKYGLNLKLGKAALSLCRFPYHCPELVITDIFMPEKDGIETIVEIRKKWPKVKILAISGGGATHELIYLNLAKELAADEPLPKHFGVQRMMGTVTGLLSS